MKSIFRFMVLVVPMLLLAAGSVLASPEVNTTILDSNTAFYQGESLRYIVPAPRHFKMITDEAARDGYSFAFVPKSERYDSASVLIGVNIYRIRGISYDSVITNDTSALREHYGPTVVIREVPPLSTATGDKARTFYLEVKHGFLPNAAIAYYNGGTEILIFELVLTEDVIRFKAEELFADCLLHFKSMKQGTLGQR